MVQTKWLRGYGERIPFQEDGMSGKHLRVLEFAVLEKTLSA